VDVVWTTGSEIISDDLILGSESRFAVARISEFNVISRSFTLYLAQVCLQVWRGSEPHLVSLCPVGVHLRTDGKAELVSKGSAVCIGEKPGEGTRGHGACRLIRMSPGGNTNLNGTVANVHAVERPFAPTLAYGFDRYIRPVLKSFHPPRRSLIIEEAAVNGVSVSQFYAKRL
jgi:hypothetical protein